MSEEFKKSGLNTVTSSAGFSVEVKIGGGVLYRDTSGEIKIDSEWLLNPFRILLYKKLSGNKDFENMNPVQIDAIFDNAVRALQFAGYQVVFEF